jgi:hypothetical protein
LTAGCQASFHGIQWARQTLEEALKVNSQSFLVWEARVRLERRLDNGPGALALIEQGRQEAPGLADAFDALENEALPADARLHPSSPTSRGNWP